MIEWQQSGPEPGKDDSDTRYHRGEGIAQITVNRPEVRKTLRPGPPSGLLNTFNIAEGDAETSVIILTGASTEDHRYPDFPRRPWVLLAHRGSLLPVWRG